MRGHSSVIPAAQVLGRLKQQGKRRRRNSQAYISHLKITEANNIESPFTLAKGCRHSAP